MELLTSINFVCVSFSLSLSLSVSPSFSVPLFVAHLGGGGSPEKVSLSI